MVYRGVENLSSPGEKHISGPGLYSNPREFQKPGNLSLRPDSEVSLRGELGSSPSHLASSGSHGKEEVV